MKLDETYSRGFKNLLPTDRDKEIARRAFNQGLKAEEVEEIIVASPIEWTRDEAKLIVSLVQAHLEQERESLQQKREQQRRQQQQKPERNQGWGMSL